MAAANLLVSDESMGGQVLRQSTVSLASKRVSVREIISARVQQEVEKYNQAKSEEAVFSGLVTPRDAEAHLNGYRTKKKRLIDAKKQIAIAEESFVRNGFFMLVDDRQVESLDEPVGITPATRVTFVKVVQLVGG